MDHTEEKGVIYILTNPSFPEIKIGYTQNLKKRLNDLNSSPAASRAFRAYAIYEVYTKLTDKKLHKLIDSLNPNIRITDNYDGKKHVKEFFDMSAEKTYSLLECIAIISGTQDRLKRVAPEGQEVLSEKKPEKKTHKPPFKFSEYGIPVGAKIVFYKDNSVVATVVDDRHIEYKGQTTAMTPLAKKLLDTKKPVQGTAYFTYKGKKLTDIRELAEKKKI